MAQEQKKLRTLLREKEAMPHLKRPGSSFGRTAEPFNANRKRVDKGRPAPPSMRSGASSSGGSSGGVSASAADLLRLRSSAARTGQCGEFVKGARRLLSAPPPYNNHVALTKGGSMASSLALS
jgi:Ase1/PRC1/MAP65 family protein